MRRELEPALPQRVPSRNSGDRAQSKESSSLATHRARIEFDHVFENVTKKRHRRGKTLEYSRSAMRRISARRQGFIP